jgi:hypothetical protein
MWNPLGASGEQSRPMMPTNLDRMTPSSTDKDVMQTAGAMAAFIGPGADGYLMHYDRMRRAGGTSSNSMTATRRHFRLSWHWPAFILTVPWMFYRKMYTGGIILVAMPILLDHLLPGSIFLGSGLLVAAIVGFCGKTWYLDHAVDRFAKARRDFSNAAERSVYLERAGGVSLSAGIFGALIQMVTATVIVLGLLPPTHF